MFAHPVFLRLIVNFEAVQCSKELLNRTIFQFDRGIMAAK